MPFKLRMNLQFFSIDEAGGGDLSSAPPEAPVAPESVETPETPPTPMQNPLLAYDTPEEQPSVQETEELDFGGRKVKVVDPSIKDIHKDYSELNRTYQSTNQRVKDLEGLLARYEQLTQQPEVPETPEQPHETAQPASQGLDVSDERMQELHEEYMDRFYENRFAAEQWWLSQPEVQQMNSQYQQQDPWVQEQKTAEQWQSTVNEMYERHDDFGEYKDVMQQIFQANPNLDVQDIESVYFEAKGRLGSSQPTPEQMMSDPNFIQQIMSNEQIRNQVLAQYQQQKQQTNQQTPFVMGGSKGGQAPSLGATTPTTIEEGGKAFREWLRQNGQF